ncbi:Uncharacterized protein APZ42_000878, partial [Daphnia magna]
LKQIAFLFGSKDKVQYRIRVIKQTLALVKKCNIRDLKKYGPKSHLSTTLSSYHTTMYAALTYFIEALKYLLSSKLPHGCNTLLHHNLHYFKLPQGGPPNITQQRHQ